VKEDFGQFNGNNFSTFGEDVNGQLYIAGVGSGKIYRINDLTTGVAQNDNQRSIQLIQIPFSNKIKIEISPNEQLKMQIEVFDMTAVKQYEVNTHESVYEFDTGILPAGIYLLKVTIDGKSQVQKFVLGK
jgi:hypothetical protein